VLIGRTGVEDVVQRLGTTILDLLPAGQIPPESVNCFIQLPWRALLDQLTTSYDTVLLDSSPVLPVIDAAVLSKQTGDALIVVGADRIHRPQLLCSERRSSCPRHPAQQD
jgi:polysaccharide biosynthesis transport protein